MKVPESEKPVKDRIQTNLWLDLASLLVMVGLAATGGLIHFILPAGSGHSHQLLGWSRHDIGSIHFYLAVAAIVLLVLHVLLHWNWLCCVVAKSLGRESPSRRTRTLWGGGMLLGIALFLVGGLSWSARMVRPASASTGRPEAQADDCPAAAAINGRTSLGEAAELCGLSLAQLIEKLQLPAGSDAKERLGQLKRSHGLDLHALRRLACTHTRS
jgi:hypothetical protein